MSETDKPSAQIHYCGPQTAKCKCRCTEGEGCDHVWDGPWEEDPDGLGGTATCSRCKMTAMEHSLWVFP